MEYYISIPDLDAQIVEIRRKIRLSMNGIVSGQMIQNGIIYKNNFGVSIPVLREMAASYASNHDLAQRLWSLEIRETMILATLLEPVEKFTAEMAQRWAQRFNQIEIIEQACMNLLCKLPYANTLCMDWIQSENSWIQISGFILAARIIAKLDHTEMDFIIQQALKISGTADFHLYKALALCLSRFCRKDIQTATFILKEINQFSQDSSTGQHYISTEVKQELLFLDIL